MDSQIALRAADVPSRAVAATGPAVEPLLAEISHEIGNYFHKLYYWSEYLGDHVAPGADPTAARTLDRSLHGLEAFVRDAFAYFHPVALTPVEMAIGDVASAMRHQASAILGDLPCRVEVPADLAPVRVAVDPGQLSHVVQIVVARLAPRATPGSTSVVQVARVPWPGPGGVAFRIGLDPAAGGPAGEAAHGVLAWARATKLVALHGGELLDVAPDRGADAAITVVLPL